MGQLIDNSTEIVTYKRTLTPAEILICGGNPYALNIPAFDGINKYFIPLNFFVKLDSGSINYDFGAAAHPVIINATLEQYVFFGKQLINNWSKPFITSLTQETHNYSGVQYVVEAPFITPLIASNDLFFTTANGTDANVGDGIYSIYITGTFIKLT